LRKRLGSQEKVGGKQCVEGIKNGVKDMGRKTGEKRVGFKPAKRKVGGVGRPIL